MGPARSFATLACWASMVWGISATFNLLKPGGPLSLGQSFPVPPEKFLASALKKFGNTLSQTLWCGLDNVAPHPDALSYVYPHLDSCCRDHDQCPAILEKNQCRNGVCNHSPVLPILSCDCELRFKDCLRDLPTYGELDKIPITPSELLLAKKIGEFYFGALPKLLKRQCIRTTSDPTTVYYTYLCENNKDGGKVRCWKVRVERWELVDQLAVGLRWSLTEDFFKSFFKTD